jgi:hypothetical protein
MGDLVRCSQGSLQLPLRLSPLGRHLLAAPAKQKDMEVGE